MGCKVAQDVGGIYLIIKDGQSLIRFETASHQAGAFGFRLVRWHLKFRALRDPFRDRSLQERGTNQDIEHA